MDRWLLEKAVLRLQHSGVSTEGKQHSQPGLEDVSPRSVAQEPPRALQRGDTHSSQGNRACTEATRVSSLFFFPDSCSLMKPSVFWFLVLPLKQTPSLTLPSRHAFLCAERY